MINDVFKKYLIGTFVPNTYQLACTVGIATSSTAAASATCRTANTLGGGATNNGCQVIINFFKTKYS